VERVLLSLAAAVAVATVPLHAQQPTPFKLGTFQVLDRTFVGVVLEESVVIDLDAASRAIEPASAVTMPSDMKDLISRYDTGVRARILEIVARVTA